MLQNSKRCMKEMCKDIFLWSVFFMNLFFPDQWYSAMCLMINTKIPQKLETAGSQLKERERHGNAVRATQSEISSQLHEKNKDSISRGRREGEGIFFLFLIQPASYPPPPFEIRRKRKTQAGKQWRQKHVSVSGGTEVDKARLWEGEVGFGN